jgi:hypothetical protein
MRSLFVTLLLIAVLGCSTQPAPSNSIRLEFAFKAQPANDSLFPIFPNPFNRVSGDTAVSIEFAIHDTSAAVLLIQNALGNPVAEFSDSLLPAGTYSGWWDPRATDGTTLMSGIYFVTLQNRGFINSRLINLQENE